MSQEWKNRIASMKLCEKYTQSTNHRRPIACLAVGCYAVHEILQQPIFTAE